MHIKTLNSIQTEYPADTVEWCPLAGQHEYFVCGTYHLEEKPINRDFGRPVRRQGRINLCKYDWDAKSMAILDFHETAAILDQKWTCINAERAVFGAATALGEVLLYTNKNDKLEALSNCNLVWEEEPVLTLSLDWNSELESSRRIVASDSGGNISMIQLTQSELTKICSWKAHSFEAWICSFDKWNSNVVYTGGDDMFLYQFDVREDNGGAHKLRINKNHRAGVTSLLSLPDNEYVMATGSYDEYIRIIDKRMFSRTMRELNVFGGLWRIKACPFDKNLLLCACMYHNFSLVELTESFMNAEIIGKYSEHKSICYGADWCHQLAADGSMTIATCSFYDKKLCISSVKAPCL